MREKKKEELDKEEEVGKRKEGEKRKGGGGGKREGGGGKTDGKMKKEEVEMEDEGEGDWVKKEGLKRREEEFGGREEEGGREEDEEEDEEEKEEEGRKESRVGKTLSELTMKRVIIIVLLLIFVVPLFESSYYFQNDRGFVNGLRVLTNLSSYQTSSHYQIQTTFQNYVNEHKDRDTPLVFCQIPSINSLYLKMNRDELRAVEKDEVFMFLPNFEAPFLAVIDIRIYSRITAGLSICRTVFVCLVLVIGTKCILNKLS